MRKFSLIVLVMFLHAGTLNSQSYRIHVKAVDSKNWAYSDIKGKIVFEPRFLISHQFSEDGFVVLYSSVNKKYSLANRHGLTIHTEVRNFFLKDIMGYGPKGYSDGLIVMREFNKWGCMDTAGRIVIPMNWDNLLEFKDGYGIGKWDKEYYVIEKASGKEIPIQNTHIVEMKHFQEGLAPFKDKWGKEGYINTMGEVAIKPDFKQVGYFNNGLAWARDFEGLIGYINTKGAWVIRPGFIEAGDFDKESGLARVRDEVRWMFVNKNGDVFNFGISEISDDFYDGLCKGKKDLLIGFYNNKGEWVIKPQFDGARDFKNGFAAAKINELWGIIDKTGNWVIEPKFEAIKDVILIR